MTGDGETVVSEDAEATGAMNEVGGGKIRSPMSSRALMARLRRASLPNLSRKPVFGPKRTSEASLVTMSNGLPPPSTRVIALAPFAATQPK